MLGALKRTSKNRKASKDKGKKIKNIKAKFATRQAQIAESQMMSS